MGDIELQDLRARAAHCGQKGTYNRDAVRLNEQILELDPSDAVATVRLARCHEENRDWLAALSCYQRLKALDGEQAWIDEKIEFAEERAAEQAAMRRDAAARERDRWLRLQERQERLAAEARKINDLPAVRLLAKQARDVGDFERALVYHDRSLELLPPFDADRAAVLSSKAATLRALGQPAAARAVLEESFELDSSRRSNKASHTCHVAVLRELGALEASRAEGDALLELYPNDPFVLRALGAALRDIAARDSDPVALERAEQCFRRAAEVDPGERDVARELRSLIALYDKLAIDLARPHLSEKARQIEEHLDSLRSRTGAKADQARYS